MTPRAVVSRPSRALVAMSVLSSSNMGCRLSHEANGKKRQRCALFSCWPQSGPGVRNELAAMPDAPVSKRLQTTIIAYSALGMFVVSVVVALVGVLPLTERLREAQKRDLMVDLQKRAVAAEFALTHIRSTAIIGGGRTKTRESLDA